ncbi:23S rRNA (pseudouridine(1915)-N(3))-methyltransferase RlmH [[Clostridium] colinum]|uniref:23S rRNA (pseudouridine(1915)-N(3))-methyltransferase RlmH n=1 Tax=[Clostridium] colinum TaxID=36835 RepID=UPI0020245DC3|nr:23S rRNA (pseudouridine(1915)-N(3))-methyltransferase RlmH [[Clostridium] colinum]
MKISIICVGKIKEKYFTMAIDEYSKRLSKYIKLNIIELPDEKAPENLSVADEENIKLKEGEKILKNIKDEFVVALCIDGKEMDSVSLANFMQNNKNKGISHICFVIGGSLGLHKNVVDRANFKLSFSKMTFPHQLMRVILLEQIYRAERILKNEPYHK